MPRLNDDVANKVEAAEDGFKPIDPGIYVIQLVEDVAVKEGEKGPYWKWSFQVVDGPFSGRKLWENTSLSEAAYFKLKNVFAAFGVPVNTDTGELVGRKIRAQVGHEVTQKGAHAGKISSKIQEFLPLDGPVGVGLASNGSSLSAAPAATPAAENKPLF